MTQMPQKTTDTEKQEHELIITRCSGNGLMGWCNERDDHNHCLTKVKCEYQRRTVVK